MPHKQLFFNGYTYTRVKRIPCPMPGREGFIIATTHGGKPAYWTSGYIYVREDKPSNPSFNAKVTGWTKKTKGYRP